VKAVAVLRIVRDDEPDAGRRRRPPVALELDGRPWLRVEPELLAELDVRDGDDLDDGRVTASHKRSRSARLFVVPLAARRIVAGSSATRCRGIPDASRDAIAGNGATRRRQLARAGAQHALAGTAPGGPTDAVLAASPGRHRRPREAYGGEDEVGLARDALQRRAITPDEPGRRRAVAFLVRRGFSTGSAWRAVKDELAARTPE
jgi:hypothetical protein